MPHLRKTERLDGIPHLFGYVDRTGNIGRGKNHSDLLSAIACSDVGNAQDPL
jgi:hypothetical protein